MFKKQRDYLWNNITPLLVFLSILAGIIFSISYFIENGRLSLIFKDIGSVIVAGAVFQFILKSKGFIKIVDETLDHTKRQWKKYSFEYIIRLLQTIRATHTFFEFDFSRTIQQSVSLAKEEYLKLHNGAKGNSRTAEDEALLRRNFFIQEMTNIRTIYKSGCEIVTYEAKIEIVKEGLFCFNYTFTPSNPDNLFPDFSKFIENTSANRFKDFSFSARVCDLPDYLSNQNININIEIDEEKKKKVLLSLSETVFLGDTFTLMFALTTKGEYTNEFLTNIKNKTNNQLTASTTTYPIGIRNIIVQEEHYGENSTYDYQLSPQIFIGKNEIQKLSELESMFYKIHKWKIFYSENPQGNVRIDLV